MTAGKFVTAGEATNGSRAVRAVWAIALAALLTLFVGASTARAETLSMTFTEARANVGADQLDDYPLFAPPATAPFTAQIDGSGSITGGVLQVPDFVTTIDDPVATDVTVDFEIGIITGSFDAATGVLTGGGTAGGTLTADGETCNIVTTPDPLVLSTTGNSGGETPRSGAPFTAGLTGAGAIAGQWTDMAAEPVDSGDPGNVNVCETVDEHIDGPGGIWLQQAGDSTPPAAPWLSTDPASPSTSAPRVRGVAEAGSTVKVYAGPGCAGTLVATGSAAELGSPGISVAVAEGVTAFFSATATDAAGNVSACSAPVSYTRQKAPIVPVDPPVDPPTCVVPKLAGKTLKQAKKALKAADCKLGEVTKPKKKKGQKKLPALVVKRSTPGRGAKPADRTVDLKLGPKPKPKAKPKKPRR